MTRIAVVAAAVSALSVACSGSDGGQEQTPTATPDARAILQLSDDAMNRLTGLKERVTGGNQPLTLLYEAPDRSQIISETGGWSSCVSGGQAWERQLEDDGTWGPWRLPATVAEWKWPDYDRITGGEVNSGAENLQFVEETEYAGEEVWVITYDYSSPTYEGTVPSADTEWIAKETHWLLKADHWQDDPYGFTGTTTTVYSGHNEPQDIECPVPGDAGEGA